MAEIAKKEEKNQNSVAIKSIKYYKRWQKKKTGEKLGRFDWDLNCLYLYTRKYIYIIYHIYLYLYLFIRTHKYICIYMIYIIYIYICIYIQKYINNNIILLCVLLHIIIYIYIYICISGHKWSATHRVLKSHRSRME